MRIEWKWLEHCVDVYGFCRIESGVIEPNVWQNGMRNFHKTTEDRENERKKAVPTALAQRMYSFHIYLYDFEYVYV